MTHNAPTLHRIAQDARNQHMPPTSSSVLTRVSGDSRTSSTFGALLATYRKRANLSQQNVAFDTGLDRTYILRLESGERIPSATTMRRLRDALELSTDEEREMWMAVLEGDR